MSTRVLEALDNLNTSQVNVDATGNTLLVAARKNRAAVMITQLGTNDVYIGAAAGVTSVTGDLLVGIKGASVTLDYNGALYGVCPTGPQAVSVAEVY